MPDVCGQSSALFGTRGSVSGRISNSQQLGSGGPVVVRAGLLWSGSPARSSASVLGEAPGLEYRELPILIQWYNVTIVASLEGG